MSRPPSGVTLGPSQLSHALGAILEPMGFEKDPDVIAAIGYRGTVAGRMLRVSAAVRARHRFTGVGNTSYRINTGLAVSVMTDPPVATRLTVGIPRLGWLATKVFLPRLEMKPLPGPEGIAVWGSEEAWAQQFMATEAFRKLVSEGSDLSVTAVVFSPVKISITCFPRTDQVETATVSQWLELTAELANAAEASPPQHRAQRTWLERQPPKTQAFLIVGLMFGVPMLLLLMFGAFLIAIIVLPNVFL